MPPAAPALSAIVIMPRGFAELAGTLVYLRAQTVRDRIEVVLVHTPAFRAGIETRAFDGFAGLVPVEVARIPTVASGFAAGAARASADVVAQVEDHVFLDPGWAEAIVEAHRGPWAAVAPRMTNANPATASSWANFVVSFGDAVLGGNQGEVDYGPGHNTSYKRSVLASYGGELEKLYQSERAFHYRLRQDGHRIYAERRARLAHTNISILREALRHSYLGGVLFGQYRGGGMSVGEKIARTALAPAVPVLRIGRLLAGTLAAPPDTDRVPPSAWALVPALLLAHAAGEAVGYWRLVAGIEGRYEHFELHRLECVRPDERGLMLGPVGEVQARA